MTIHSSRSWIVLVILTMAVTMAWGQLYTGSITGTVTDPTGAVVPNANITITDVGKGFTTKSVTDSQGRFVVRSLPPSTYQVKVEAAGFRPAAQDKVVLNVNQNLTLDFPLSIATAETSVQVIESGVAALATQDAATGQVLDRTFLNDLPLVGRQVFDLARLAPGISEPRGNGGWSNNFISQGSRNATADVLLDGVSTVAAEQNSSFQMPLYTPSVDAVQEFKVQQSGFSAEQGFTGSTVLNMITRSGTNQFHGSGYWFHRNETINAQDFFSRGAGLDKPAMKWNQFGGTLGGPIKKDRLFFFTDYEGTRNQSAATFRSGVPSAAMKAGDFAEICGTGFDSSGKCKDANGQLWDPYVAVFDVGNGGPVRKQFIPFNNIAKYISPGSPTMALPQSAGNLIDPVAKKMMSYFPEPNYKVGTSEYNRFNNWIGNGSDQNNNDQFDAKIDWRINDSNMLSGKVAWGWAKGQPAHAYDNPMDPYSSGPSTGGPRLGAINWTDTLNATTVLTVSAGATRSFQDRPGVTGDFPDYNYIQELGLPSYMTASGLNAAPTIYLNSYASPACCGNFGGQGWGIMMYASEVYHLTGSVSKIMGKHELKVGAESRLHRINFRQAGYPGSLLTFQNNSTSEYPWWNGGDPMAGFLLGYPGYGAWGGVQLPLYVSTTAWKYAGFVQDNWRVTPKLTLNLGVRYDVEMPRTERYNRLSYLDPTAPSPVTVPGMDLRGAVGFTTADQPRQFDTDSNNFAPRFGFAFQANPKVVFRGGYGLFYMASNVGAAGTGPGGNLGFQPETPWQSSDPRIPQSPYPFALLRNPAPLGITPYPNASELTPAYNIGRGVQSPIRSWNMAPYEQTWTLSIQHELPGAMLLEAAYIGKKGSNLLYGGAGQQNYIPEVVGQDYMRGNGAFWNTNVTNPFYGRITDPNSGLSAPTVSRQQLMRRFPQYEGYDGGHPPWANSNYHALQLRFEKRLSKGLQFLTSYVLSKSIDDVSSSGSNTDWLGNMSSGSPTDPHNRRLDRSISMFDQTHQFQFSWVYSLPFGKGRTWGGNWNPVVNGILGGWQLNGIYRWTNGFPIALSLQDGQSVPDYGGQRPNLSDTLVRAENWKDNLFQYFANPSVVSKPAQYTISTAPRALTSVRWPGVNNWSASMFKRFEMYNVREGMAAEVRLETFNTMNYVQFAAPNQTFGSGSFGQITGQGNSPRQVQIGAKFYF